MKNVDIIKMFISGETKGNTKNLKIVGDKLFNYNTIIAKRRDDGGYKLNITKYSNSTTIIQNQLRNMLEEENASYSLWDAVRMGESDL